LNQLNIVIFTIPGTPPSEIDKFDNATALEEFAISECSCCLRVVAISNKSEDRLVKRLLNSSKHNLLNTPVADVGEVLHVELGLVLKNIIQVVR